MADRRQEHGSRFTRWRPDEAPKHAYQRYADLHRRQEFCRAWSQAPERDRPPFTSRSIIALRRAGRDETMASSDMRQKAVHTDEDAPRWRFQRKA